MGFEDYLEPPLSLAESIGRRTRGGLRSDLDRYLSASAIVQLGGVGDGPNLLTGSG